MLEIVEGAAAYRRSVIKSWIVLGILAAIVLVIVIGSHLPKESTTAGLNPPAPTTSTASTPPQRQVIQRTSAITIYAYETATGDTVKEYENARGEIFNRRISRPAPAACGYLREVGLHTGEYWRDEPDSIFLCGSPYREFGTVADPLAVGLKNNLAYYVKGDAERVHDMKLILNVNQRHEAKQAHRELLRAAQRLTRQATNTTLPKAAEQAIAAGKAWQGSAQGMALALTRTNWPTGKGYDLMYHVGSRRE